MTELVFVDTNVLVHAQDIREPGKQQRAREWLERLWRTQSGRTSVQVLNEYYVTVTRKLQPGLPEALAWNHVDALGAWQPKGMDVPLMQRARSLAGQAQLSWWDALVIAAAQLQGCSLLLSEDLGHRARFGNVRVHNPFIDEIQQHEPAEYPQAPIEPRHPARGRPRRERRAAGAD